MSKVKFNDKNFLHDNNNKADEKKNCGVKNTQDLNVEPDLLVSAVTQQRSVSQSVSQPARPEVPLHREWVQAGCVTTVKWLETQQWILWFSPLKAITWLILGFLKTSREIDFSVLTTLGVLGEVLYSLKGVRTPSQSSHGCSGIRHCSPGTAAKHWGFVCFSTSQHLGVSCLTAVQGFKAGYVPGNIFKPRGELIL